MNKSEFIDKITEVYRKKTPGFCQMSKEKFNASNSVDGVHGYQIAIAHPDMPSKSIFVEVTKKVYLDWYKVAYPKAQLPKI